MIVVLDHVVPVAQTEHVHVRAIASVQHVVARATDQHVVARTTEQPVIALAAEQRPVSGPGVQRIVTVTAKHQLMDTVTRKRVTIIATTNRRICRSSLHGFSHFRKLGSNHPVESNEYVGIMSNSSGKECNVCCYILNGAFLEFAFQR